MSQGKWSERITLDVEILPDNKYNEVLKIGFKSKDRAKAYHRLAICERWYKGWLSSDEEAVCLPLMTKVQRLEASQDYGEFVFVFDKKEDADEWLKHYLIGNWVDEIAVTTCIQRDWVLEDLHRLLDIPLYDISNPHGVRRTLAGKKGKARYHRDA